MPPKSNTGMKDPFRKSGRTLERHVENVRLDQLGHGIKERLIQFSSKYRFALLKRLYAGFHCDKAADANGDCRASADARRRRENH